MLDISKALHAFENVEVKTGADGGEELMFFADITSTNCYFLKEKDMSLVQHDFNRQRNE